MIPRRNLNEEESNAETNVKTNTPDPDSLVTPDGPTTNTEPAVPAAPSAQKRDAPSESITRRRRLDLGHAPVNRDAAWSGEADPDHCSNSRTSSSPPSRAKPGSAETDDVDSYHHGSNIDWRDDLDWSTDHVGAAEQLRREIERDGASSEECEETTKGRNEETAASEPRTQLLGKTRPRMQTPLAASPAVNISRRVEEERAKKCPRRYVALATNNLQALLADESGSRCYHCLGRPVVGPDTETCDETTVLCPLCTVDSVVPASAVPDEATIHAWRFLAFFDTPEETPDPAEECGEKDYPESIPPDEISKTSDTEDLGVLYHEQRAQESSLEDLPKLDPTSPPSTYQLQATDPKGPAASEAYSSQASSQSSQPAAYIDTRPVTVAFKGDAAGATVIILGGATAPIEQGGHGMQANQDITINASRCQTHPHTQKDQEEQSRHQSLSPYSRRSFAYESFRKTDHPVKCSALEAQRQRRKPARNASAIPPKPAKPSRSSRDKAAVATAEWRCCGIENVYASIRRPEQDKATYVPSWQAQLWDPEKGEQLRGPRRYNYLEAARDVAELSRKKQTPRLEIHQQDVPTNQTRPSCYYDPAINEWYTGRATLLDDHVGVIVESASANGQQYSFEYNNSHGFPRQLPAPEQHPDPPISYWVAFRKDPKVHPGQALSVVRLLTPEGPSSRTAPAHRPPLSEGRYSLPLVSIVDALPTVRELYARFYEDPATPRPIKYGRPTHSDPCTPPCVTDRPDGSPALSEFKQDDTHRMARGKDLTLQYVKFPERLGAQLHLYARVYMSGLTFPYGGEQPDLNTAGEKFEHKYCVLLNYMLSHAPKELFSQIQMKGIYFVKNLTYGGIPTRTLVVPSAGVILVNLTELSQALNAATEPGLLKILTHKVSRVLHEISHLCDYTADPEGWQMPDSMLEFLLPNYKFPTANSCQIPDISSSIRRQLPNHMLYAATAPEELRAESLADIWMSEGPSRDQQKRAQAYWEARSRGVLPALYSMLKKGFQEPGYLPSWGRDALFLYRIGDHREVTPLAVGLRELAHCRSTRRTRQQCGAAPAFAGEPDETTEDVERAVEPPLWQIRMNNEIADAQLGASNSAPQVEETSSSPMPDYALTETACNASQALIQDESQEETLSPRMTGASGRITRRGPNSGVTPYKQNWNRYPEWRGEKRTLVAAVSSRHPGFTPSLTKPQQVSSHAIQKRAYTGSLGARRPGRANGKTKFSPPEYRGDLSFLADVNSERRDPLPRRPANQPAPGPSRMERNRRNRDATDSFLTETCPHRFLEDMECRHAHSLRRPSWKQLSAEIEVRFDVKGEHRGQIHRILIDLNESAAVLLYQIVLQIIGHVSRNMLGWRLLGGPCRVGFDEERPGRVVGLREGSHYTLVGKMRGGGDEPPHPNDPNIPLESPVGAGHLDQLSLGLLEALPATPAQTPSAPEAGTSSLTLAQASSEVGECSSRPEPLQFSPPYRPLEGESTEEPAEVRAEDTTLRPKGKGPVVPRPPPAATRDATPNIPPATPLEARISHSEKLPPAEAGAYLTATHPQLSADELYIEAEIQRRVNQKIEARIEAETQSRLALIDNPPLEEIEEEEFHQTQEGIGADGSLASAEPSRANRSVNFGSVPRPHPTEHAVEEPASLPHRPRSERAPGTETRWQHFQNSGPEPRWDDDQVLPSRQSSTRSESPPSPPYRGHGPGTTPAATTSARAARRGATGSTFSMPNDNDEDTQEDTLSYWEKEESTTFTDAPSESTMRRYFERHQVDPAVIELVERVRRQPWQANTASPHTNCFNPNLERPPLRQKQYSTKKLSETRTSQKDFKFFNDQKLTAPTEHDQLNAWIRVRAEMCITLRTCVDTRCAGPEFLPAIRDELNRLLGHTQALPQLAALIVQGLQTFVTLASNCLLLACDNHFCPEYSPLTALQTVQRKSGQALVDLFANIELLMLQSKNQEQEGRDFLYVTMRHTDRQVIPDLHRYAVQAIESGDQPWAAEVALAFDRACTNARAYARTVSERDRPAVLQLQAIAFTAGIIGLDQNLSLGYRNGGQLAYGSYNREDPSNFPRQPRTRSARTRNTVAPVTTRSAGPPPRVQQQPSLTPASPAMSQQRQPPPPPPPPQQLQHLRPMEPPSRPMDRPDGYQSTEQRRNAAPPGKQEATTTNLWIDMAEVRRAAEESEPARKRLAIMIWPTDDCSRFAADIECKATPVFETDGKPAYFNDGRPMVTFNNKKACRFCSVWAAQPGNMEDWKSWPQEVRDGQHNPKVCPRSIAALLKTGTAGASFLKERWGKNRPTRPEGGQRRAGQ